MKRRALVLGAGGHAAIAWELGVITGMADAGVALRDADLGPSPESYGMTFLPATSNCFAAASKCTSLEYTTLNPASAAVAR